MGIYAVTTGKLTLAAAATKSLILITPVNATKLRQLDISLGAAAAAEEVEFDLYRVNALGAPEGEAATPELIDERDTAASDSALIAKASENGFKKEPTSVKVIAPYLIQPLGGLLSMPFPYGAEPGAAKGGKPIGLRYTTPAGVTPTCIATLWFEE
jgi:hypothetical protein